MKSGAHFWSRGELHSVTNLPVSLTEFVRILSLIFTLSAAYDKPLSFSRNTPAKRGQFLDNVKCSGIVGGRLRIAQYAIFSVNGSLGQRAIAAPK